MFAYFLTHPLLWGAFVLLADMLCWHFIPVAQRVARLGTRLVLFVLYSVIIINAGISPLLAPPWPDDNVLQLAATALAIFWWIYAARVLTEIIGLLLMRRIGHSGRLLQDVVGAVVFLVAIVAAAGYVLQLPVKGLLATSGAVAIIVGLALQSTLSDVFSGIVLNTTKPYQVDDWIMIDGTEGKVLDISWRATYLLTSTGSTAVVPNSVAAKAKIVNLSRPSDRHGVSISIKLPNQIRPRRVLDALERALRGSNALLTEPAPKVVLKEAGEAVCEYVASGFIASLGQRSEVRNQLFDLAHRHLEAAGITRQTEGNDATLPSRARVLLEEVKIFRSLDSEQKDRLAKAMVPRDYAAGQVVLDVGEVPEYLLVIGTGVISASIPDGPNFREAGRMGPSEVMGEQSVLADTPSEARFTTLSSCTLYRIEKAVTRELIEHRATVGNALNKLQAVRQQTAHAVLLNRPVAIKRGGFLSWLKR